MVKTIELIAKDMRASCTTSPDPTPCAAVRPQQSLFERNPTLSAMRGPLRRAVQQTLRMRFDVAGRRRRHC